MNLVLTASSLTALVDATVTITATVTNNGEPVPNGTAVEFQASAGVLNGGGQAALKTTTGGVATVTLTSGTAQTVRVTATVNNVTRQIDVTFQARTNPPPPPNTAPTITSVNPAIGRPQGGQVVRITGTNFKAPVRVLFDTGGVTPIEGSVQLVTDTLIEVITPPVNLGAGQQLAADVIVFTQAGTANEQRVEASGAFTFRNEQLQPVVYTVSPNSGPVVGGTRVTIFGEGFQAPVQVLFGTAEARVLNVNYDRIEVEAPAGRDTTPNGSDPTTGPVPVTVRNINSNLADTMEVGFHYKQAILITGVAPIVSASTGGQQVIIDGVGFVAPIDVVINGVRAQTLEVSGTRLVVRTGPLRSPCITTQGQIVINNVVNGDSVIWGDEPNETPFTYLAVEPRILEVDLPAGDIIPGSVVTATVRDPGVGPLGSAEVTFLLGTRPVVTSPSRITTGLGDQEFTFTVPTNLVFPTVGCTVDGVPGTQLGAADIDLTFRNLTTDCDAIIPAAVHVEPDPVTNPCVIPPPPDVEQVVPISPACASAGNVTVGETNDFVITFRNAGGRNLIITPDLPIFGDHPTDFDIPEDSIIIAPGANGSFTLTFSPTAVGERRANVRFITNDPDDAEQEIVICLRGFGI